MNRSEKIDAQALKCCRQMVGKERMEWLKEWQDFKHSALGYKGKVDVGIKYYKGKKKGQVRDVWDIDGVEFMKLWKLVENYVYTSAHGSNYRSLQEGVEDDVSEIKLLMFRSLRFFGPYPANSTFSGYLKLCVNNILTNSSSRRGDITGRKSLKMFISEEIEEGKGKKPNFKEIAERAIAAGFCPGQFAKPSKDQLQKNFERVVVCVGRTWRKYQLLQQQNFSRSLTEQNVINVQVLNQFKQPSSIFDVIKTGSEDGEAVQLAATIESPDEGSEFLLGVPEKLKSAVELILYGSEQEIRDKRIKSYSERLREVAPKFGMTTKQFKGYLQSNLL